MVGTCVKLISPTRSTIPHVAMQRGELLSQAGPRVAAERSGARQEYAAAPWSICAQRQKSQVKCAAEPKTTTATVAEALSSSGALVITEVSSVASASPSKWLVNSMGSDECTASLVLLVQRREGW